MSVGLDIGSKTIKVIELSKEGKGYRLRAAGAIGYSGAQVEKFQEDRQFNQLASTVKKLFKDAKIGSKDVSIALPETLTYSRIMKFPMLNDQEIASAVKWEAEEYIPIPVSEAVIEHQILERRETGTPPQVYVLLIAASKKLVEKYVKLVQMAGLNLVGVETELLSLVRSLAPAGRTSLIVDFGASSTDIAISKGEQLFFSRSIPTAGDAFTRAVAQSLGITPKQAEEYKRAYGLSPGQLEGKVGSALSPIFKVVVEEIKKAIQYYQLDVKGESPSVIVLSGGSSGMPGAISSLTKLLGGEVLVGNPFNKVAVDAESSKSLASYTPLYAIAVGLAMRGG